MPSTTTSQPISNHTDLELSRAEAVSAYRLNWERMSAQWNSPDQADKIWLTYSANYILRTGGVLWGLDPFRLCARLPNAPAVAILPDLKPLKFVMLTHRHSDHLDLPLMKALQDEPIKFIVPEFLLEILREKTGIPAERMLVPQHMQPMRLEGVTLTPFNGLHWEAEASRPDGLRGVPSMGCLVEFNGKRWLSPGDTRTYRAEQLPAFGEVDGLVAHVWLGRGAAGHALPPLLDEFGQFCLDLQPRRILLTHFNEWGRPQQERWTARHAKLALEWFRRKAPRVQVTALGMGMQAEL